MFDRIKCIFGRHKYEVIQEFDRYNRRIGCPVCKKEWIMGDDTLTLLPWDHEWQSFYRNIHGDTIVNPRWYKQ